MSFRRRASAALVLIRTCSSRDAHAQTGGRCVDACVDTFVDTCVDTCVDKFVDTFVDAFVDTFVDA